MTAEPTAAPTLSPTTVVASASVPIAILAGDGTQSTLTISYMPSTQERIASPDFEMQLDAPAVAALGGGGGGTTDVAVWQRSTAGQTPQDVLEVYRIAPARPATRHARLVLPARRASVGRSRLNFADVDPSIAGEEIIAAEANGRGDTRVCVFGGLADGELRLLRQFRPLSRHARSDGALAGFAIGDVLPDTEHAGQEIVAGGRGGTVRIYGMENGLIRFVRTLKVYPDAPHASAERLAVGDLLPDHPGDEIAVGDDGSRHDASVRILDGHTGRLLMEFQAFAPADAPDGLQLWAGDILPALPGAELIVGQGSAGGTLRVFTLASGIPKQVLDIPDPLHRNHTSADLLAIGDLLPDLPGNEVVVAQSDPQLPLQIVHFDSANIPLSETVPLSGGDGTISAIAIGR